MKTNYLIASIIMMLTFVSANAQTVNGELKRWHKVTINFDGPNTSETASPNPFLDFDLQVTFTHSDGKSYTVPGYFAACGDAANTNCSSGDQWKVHFSPDRTGTWNWEASFRSGNEVAINGGGSIAGFMHGTSGSFNILESDKTGLDHRSADLGRLQYVGEHYLRYSGTNPDNPNGRWFFKFGPDAPENMLAYDDFDGTPNRVNRRKSWDFHQGDYDASEAAIHTWDEGKGTEILGVVKYLADEGANVFSFLTFSLAGDDENVFPHLLRVPESTYNGFGDGAQWNDGVHQDRFDISKLDQWERLFEYADQKGFYLHFKTQETENDQRMDGGNVGTERKVYYRELVARFSHHLALNWNTGEENSQTEAQEIAMADYLSSIDPYGHNIVMHTYPNDKDRYLPLLGNSSEYTGASLQSSINAVHNDIITWVNNSNNAGKKWIVANDEQGPASQGVNVDASYPDSQLPATRNATDNRDNVRHRVLWGTLLAGGAGVEYYYGSQTGCADQNCADHRTRASKWADAKIAKDFFNTYLQDNLIDMSSADNLTSDNNDYVFAEIGEVYAIYLPDGGSTNLNLNGVGGTLEVRWYDPRNGGGLQNGSITSVSGGATVSIGNPPNNSSNDWVVLVTGDGEPCNPLPSVTPTSAIESGINFEYFEGSWNVLPNFGALSPVDDGQLSNIGIGSASSADNYGFVFTGYIDIPNAGEYTFYTNSDDGSALWIDGNQVVNNDGLHGANEESGNICLDAGYHAIRVEFFEKTGGSLLSVSYAGPGISKTTSLDLFAEPGDVIDCSLPWTDSDFTISNTTVNYNSGAIDISCVSSACVSMDIEGVGSMEDADFLNVYYSVDGGSQQILSENVNAFTEKTVSACGLSGNSVVITIQGATSVAAETYFISNIQVSEGMMAEDCNGDVGGTASIDACGVCSGGNTGITPSSPTTWYEDSDGDGSGDALSSVEACDQPTGYVSNSSDQCPTDANKSAPGECGCGVVDGTCNPTGNLALNGTATQSSVHPVYGGEPGRAIDGNTDGNWGGGSVTHTITETNPWWQVDLGAAYNISEIDIYNRTNGCCDQRLTNFTVYILDNNGNITFSQSFNSYPDPSITVNGGGALGQVVRIELDETNVLSLAEVEVYGTTSNSTDCAGVIGGTASIDACGICSGGTTGVTPTSPQNWYEDADGDGAGDAGSVIQTCDQPNNYVAVTGDDCPNDGNKTSPGDCGCGVAEGTCSGCTITTAFTEAECFSEMSGVEVQPTTGGGENIGHTDAGDWARYNGIDLSNVNTVNIDVATVRNGSSIEVRLNSVSGTLIATVPVSNTGDWENFVNHSESISNVSGVHDIFLVFQGNNNGLLNVDFFGFSDEDVVEPSDCSSLTSNISISHTNPTCSDNNGTILVTFGNASDQSQIQLSLDGGNTYPVTVNDNSGSYTFSGLSEAEYEVAARYGDGSCAFNVGTMALILDCGDIPLSPNGVSWLDSYHANGHCWCSSTFDHDLDEKTVTINGTPFSVVDICDELESHPSYRTRNNSDNIYNDIQCGNGPLNNSFDEPLCPGRVDIGVGGCLETGYHWDMEWLAGRDRFVGNNNAFSSILAEQASPFVLLQEETIDVYPNPVTNGTYITINSELVIIDAKLVGVIGSSNLTLDGNKSYIIGYPSGIYSLVVTYVDGSSQTVPLVIN